MDSREEEFRDLRETQGEGERAYPVTETKKLGAPREVQTTFVASPEGRNARDDCWFSTRARRCVGAHRQPDGHLDESGDRAPFLPSRHFEKDIISCIHH